MGFCKFFTSNGRYFFLKSVISIEDFLMFYNHKQVSDYTRPENKLEYQILKDKWSKEFYEGSFDLLKCLDPIIVNLFQSLGSEVFNNGSNHFNNRISLKLIRKSEMGTRYCCSG